MKALAKKNESFPALSGNIVEDTESVIGELAVGTIVVERGLARLYLIWRGKGFLDIKRHEYRCTACGLELIKEDDHCPRCGGTIFYQEVPVYPTLNDYVAFISDETGKSRQTLFNRLRVYRSLCDDRGTNPISVFELNLLSPGAAKRLADANEDDDKITLENNSWQDTVEKALSLDSKSMALEYVKYDVLHKPKISVEKDSDGSYTVYREFDGGGEEYTVEQYGFKLAGKWNDSMVEWLDRKIGASTK